MKITLDSKTINVPSDADALEEFLSGDDKDTVKTVLGSPQNIKEFMAAYVKEHNANDTELQEQLEEQRERNILDVLEKHGYERVPGGKGRLPQDEDMETSQGMRKVYEGLGLDRKAQEQLALTASGAGMKLVGKWPRLGKFVQDTIGAQTDQKALSEEAMLAKALGESQGDQGGFLLPEEHRAQLLGGTLESTVVRPRATVVPMARSTLLYPTIRDSSHASSVYGGIWARYVAEAGTMTVTDEPSFAQLRMTAKKLQSGTRISNELLRDSEISLEGILMPRFRDAVAYKEDDAFISGIGAAMPVGILNADALVTVSKETGQAATTIVWENIIKMWARMLPQSMGRSVWVANQDTIPQLAVMSLAVGTGGSAVWHTNGQGGLPNTLMGRPIVYTEKAETLGTAGDLYLVDFSQYLIADRQSLEIRRSEHSRFLNDQTEIVFLLRHDGRPIVDTALTPRNGSNTLTPYVNLATRS